MSRDHSLPKIRVQFAVCLAPRDVQVDERELPVGTTVAQALQVLGRALSDDDSVGVWNRKASLDHVLRDGDRVEIYRALQVDPKVARRERFAQQGRRGAGLFSREKR